MVKIGTIEINDSPVKLSKEEKIIREESDTLKDNECKIIRKRGVFKKDKLICKKKDKITIKDLD
jgi:hypothetical protein